MSVRVIGVDLAWGDRARSGLCAVEDGQVLASGSARTDGEIDGWLSAWTAAEMLVAIDAPLIVANASGGRPCDRVVSRAYHAAEAGCYPANTALPCFRDGGRALALARRWNLATDPCALGVTPLRVAIEVYPHAALVSLFDLKRSLKYKAKRGRSVADRQLAFAELLERLEQLRDFSPPLDVKTGRRWPAIRAALREAKTGAVLERFEDEVDAYVCAYVGLHHLARQGTGASLTVGDATYGYIVTPVDASRAARIAHEAGRLGVRVTA